jgi:poly(3-hydroxyalkanoate) synthetase
VLELIQYRPQAEQVGKVPLLIAPPTINTFYAIDLAPGRSLWAAVCRPSWTRWPWSSGSSTATGRR